MGGLAVGLWLPMRKLRQIVFIVVNALSCHTEKLVSQISEQGASQAHIYHLHASADTHQR